MRNYYRYTLNPSVESRLKIYKLIQAAYTNQRPWIDYAEILNKAIVLRASRQLLAVMEETGIEYLENYAGNLLQSKIRFGTTLTLQQLQHPLTSKLCQYIDQREFLTKDKIVTDTNILSIVLIDRTGVHINTLTNEVDFTERFLTDRLKESLDTLMFIIETICY